MQGSVGVSTSFIIEISMAIFRRPRAQPLGSAADPDAGVHHGDLSQGQPPRTGVGSSTAAAGAPRAPAESLPPALLVDREVSEIVRKRERKLVEAACRGEHSAIEALYRNHYDTIFRYVTLRLGSAAAAEDVASQVFLGMIRGLSRYQDEGKPFIAWLYGIAQRQIAFFQRGQGRQPLPVDLDSAGELLADTAGPHATAEGRELRLRVAKALGRLPDGQREVITLRYVLSLSLAETAAAVGRTEGAVKQLQLRGLNTLKSILGPGGIELL